MQQEVTMTRPFWMTTCALVLSGTALIMSTTTAATAGPGDKFALVNFDGTLARGKGVVLSSRSFPGRYLVHFNTNTNPREG
jgi:hypothetical protein